MVVIKHAAVWALVLWVSLLTSSAQECILHISGKVTDKSKESVPGVVVHLLNSLSGTASDSAGNFMIEKICPGKVVLVAESIGYTAISFDLNVQKDMTVNLVMTAKENELGMVIVNGEKLQGIRTISTTELKGVELLQTRGSSLGEALKELPGLNSVQTGPTLSKPVIHGLSSNRILVMNDGIRQEGQQWGSEHAPEVDPFIANKIIVVKGAASVRYGSDAIGGVILLNPDEMPHQKSITGNTYAVGATNGQMGAFSGTLEGAFDKSLEGLSWRVQGTLKEAGDFHTPRYYLTNTGLKEDDYSASVGYKKKEMNFILYYSKYFTHVGIFTGAESGSEKELQAKFAMPTPGLPSYFSYDVNRPYQTVLHELAKASASYEFHNKGKVEMNFARQNDIRQEYDELTTTNPAAANSPQLRFQLITHSVELVYTQPALKGFTGSFGITGLTSGNTFEGVRSLIPNYRDYNGGAFAIERYSYGKFIFETGLRYDYRWLRVYERNPTTLDLYNVTYTYSNTTGTAGCTFRYDNHLSASLNAGTAWRAPSINEMYIYGEHFSDASFEVGDSTLKSERSLNTGLTIKYTAEKFRAEVDAYYNRINNYIYDKPALRYRQLPSGTFPEFDYTQANVIIRGLDASLQYDVLPHLTLQSKTTIVRGYNESINDWLISMPCDRFENGLEFHLPVIGPLKAPYLALENVSVLTQTRIPPNSEYVPPPAGYYLFNANAGFNFPFGANVLSVSFTVNNIANVAYRDYLDHFRYYADELGINYILRLKYSF